MANQNVGTPRFYIDQFSYLLASGQVDSSYYEGHTDASPGSNKDVFQYPGLIGLTPNIKYVSSLSAGVYRCYDIPTNFNIATPIGDKTAYACFLGHNCRTASTSGVRILSEWHDGDGGKQATTEGEIVNLTGSSTNYPPFDGFTIWEISGEPGNANESRFVRLCVQQPNEAYTIEVHSLSWGFIYEMPVAPDLSLSLEHDYSGIQKTTSMSGASFSNANWIKPPKWGDKEAWQLGDFPRPYSGRRVWDLSFSYISDSDLEPRNYTGTTDDTPPQQGTDNWFENVLHYTMGGHLPFIFQPNKDATYVPEGDYIGEIPELAICRFDMDTFSREQVAVNVYNIKVKIKETW